MGSWPEMHYMHYMHELKIFYGGRKKTLLTDLLISYKETLWRDWSKLERIEKEIHRSVLKLTTCFILFYFVAFMKILLQLDRKYARISFLVDVWLFFKEGNLEPLRSELYYYMYSKHKKVGLLSEKKSFKVNLVIHQAKTLWRDLSIAQDFLKLLIWFSLSVCVFYFVAYIEITASTSWYVCVICFSYLWVTLKGKEKVFTY